jgi:hypothetical protein
MEQRSWGAGSSPGGCNAQATLAKKLRTVLFDNTFAELLTKRKNKPRDLRIAAECNKTFTGGVQ